MGQILSTLNLIGYNTINLTSVKKKKVNEKVKKSLTDEDEKAKRFIADESYPNKYAKGEKATKREQKVKRER
jgi:hypothetical protein